MWGALNTLMNSGDSAQSSEGDHRDDKNHPADGGGTQCRASPTGRCVTPCTRRLHSQGLGFDCPSVLASQGRNSCYHHNNTGQPGHGPVAHPAGQPRQLRPDKGLCQMTTMTIRLERTSGSTEPNQDESGNKPEKEPDHSTFMQTGMTTSPQRGLSMEEVNNLMRTSAPQSNDSFINDFDGDFKVACSRSARLISGCRTCRRRTTHRPLTSRTTSWD